MGKITIDYEIEDLDIDEFQEEVLEEIDKEEWKRRRHRRHRDPDREYGKGRKLNKRRYRKKEEVA